MSGAIPLHAFVPWTRTTLPLPHAGSKPHLLGRPALTLGTPIPARRTIYRPCMRDEVLGEWRKLRNEEPNDLYSSLNISRVLKSRMRWPGHVAHRGLERCIQGFGGETRGKKTAWKT